MNYFQGKKLYRSPKDALIFGVAAGLAQYTQVDVVFVRLALVVLGVVIGWVPLFLMYIVAHVLIPIDPTQDTVRATQEPKDVTPVGGPDKMDASQNM